MTVTDRHREAAKAIRGDVADWIMHGRIDKSYQAKVEELLAAHFPDPSPLLQQCVDALAYFKAWGEELNKLVGYKATTESWAPIDAALSAAAACGVTPKGTEQ